MNPMRAFGMVVLSAALHVQVVPPRDAQRSRPEAPATVKGRVVFARTGQPARNTYVTMQRAGPSTALGAGPSTELRAGARASHTILTAADGTFAFTEVEPGRYTLSALKNAYLTTQYGEKQPGGQGTPFDVGAGVTLPNMNLELRKGSVVTGRIVDALGEPVQHAMVGLIRDVGRSTARAEAPAGIPVEVAGNRTSRSFGTNDLGHFRVFGLLPGDYIVSATLAEGVDRLAQGLGVASPGGMARTYYPGTILLAEAQPVRVGLESELGGIDFVLQSIRKVRVRGAATTSRGHPLEHGSISLDLDHPRRLLARVAGRSLDANGRFEISSVPPGDYIATVIERSRDGAPDPPEVAQVAIRVAAEDLDGLAISTAQGVTAAGQVRFDGDAPKVDAGSGALVAQPPDGGAPQATARFQLRDDWSFELRGLFGRRLLRWPKPPTGWELKAVMLAGRDVTNEAMDFKPGVAPPGAVEIRFVRRR